MFHAIICLLLALCLGCGRSRPLKIENSVDDTKNKTTPDGTTTTTTNSGASAPVTGGEISHRVFLSSLSYGPNLGGLAGADAKCQALATAQGVTGSWKAILSDSTTSARDRLNIRGPVRDLLGREIALNAAELWSGAIKIKIQYDEKKVLQSTAIVWTGTNSDGAKNANINSTQCANWSADSGGVQAGRTDFTDYRWIAIYIPPGQTTNACNNTLRLYCIDNVN